MHGTDCVLAHTHTHTHTGVNDVFDADLDGIPNNLDLDSDNDGIPDLVEAGGIDTDHNGRVDGFVDLDHDGEDDATALHPLPNADTDSDFMPNALDLDSDGDLVYDIVEAGGIDRNGDGKVDDSLATDANRDGLADAMVANPLPGVPRDVDGDGQCWLLTIALLLLLLRLFFFLCFFLSSVFPFSVTVLYYFVVCF